MRIFFIKCLKNNYSCIKISFCKNQLKVSIKSKFFKLIWLVISKIKKMLKIHCNYNVSLICVVLRTLNLKKKEEHTILTYNLQKWFILSLSKWKRSKSSLSQLQKRFIALIINLLKGLIWKMSKVLIIFFFQIFEFKMLNFYKTWKKFLIIFLFIRNFYNKSCIL